MPEDLIRDLYAAFGDRNEERLRTLLAPEVVWNQCEGFPGGANRRGPQDVLDGILGKNSELWNDFRAEIDEYLPSGNTVVVLGRYSGTHSKTGKSMRVAFEHVYRVRDGQVIRFDQITDTAPMVAAMN
ncbi:MAG: nuclear transport factor 2 family protein [Planctomycetota bacterium]